MHYSEAATQLLTEAWLTIIVTLASIHNVTLPDNNYIYAYLMLY